MRSLSSGDQDGKRQQYLTSLKNLNESVTKWIKSHVEKNPFCILTPIFTDYEQHLKTLEKLDPEKSSVNKNENGQNSSSTQKGIYRNALYILCSNTSGLDVCLLMWDSILRAVTSYFRWSVCPYRYDTL